MILHNIGSKIINVGTTILMPGESMNINADTAKLPAIQAFCEMGFVMVEGDKIVPDHNDTEATAEEAPAPAKRGRKPAAATSEAADAQ